MDHMDHICFLNTTPIVRDLKYYTFYIVTFNSYYIINLLYLNVICYKQ